MSANVSEPAGFVPPPRNHNGGPPLDDHVPEWGRKGIGTYFAWRRSSRQAWGNISRDTALRRLKKAQACGLTYEEYTVFLLDTGRYLQPTDTEIIERIIAQRQPACRGAGIPAGNTTRDRKALMPARR